MPAPSASPWTTATETASADQSARATLWKAASIPGARSGVWSATSAPALNARVPAARITRMSTGSLPVRPPTAPARLSKAAVLRMLSGGRLMVIVPTDPSRSSTISGADAFPGASAPNGSPLTCP